MRINLLISSIVQMAVALTSFAGDLRLKLDAPEEFVREYSISILTGVRTTEGFASFFSFSMEEMMSGIREKDFPIPDGDVIACSYKWVFDWQHPGSTWDPNKPELLTDGDPFKIENDCQIDNALGSATMGLGPYQFSPVTIILDSEAAARRKSQFLFGLLCLGPSDSQCKNTNLDPKKQIFVDHKRLLIKETTHPDVKVTWFGCRKPGLFCKKVLWSERFEMASEIVTIK